MYRSLPRFFDARLAWLSAGHYRPLLPGLVVPLTLYVAVRGEKSIAPCVGGVGRRGSHAASECRREGMESGIRLQSPATARIQDTESLGHDSVPSVVGSQTSRLRAQVESASAHHLSSPHLKATDRCRPHRHRDVMGAGVNPEPGSTVRRAFPRSSDPPGDGGSDRHQGRVRRPRRRQRIARRELIPPSRRGVCRIMTSNLIFVSLSAVKHDAALGKHCAAALLSYIVGVGRRLRAHQIQWT